MSEGGDGTRDELFQGLDPAVGAIRSVAVDKGASSHAQIQGCWLQGCTVQQEQSSGKSLGGSIALRLAVTIPRITDAETLEQLSSVPFLQ